MVWLKEMSLKEKKLRKRGKEREREIPTTAGYLEAGGGGARWGSGGVAFSKSPGTNSSPPAAPCLELEMK